MSGSQRCWSENREEQRLEIMQEQVGHEHASTTLIYTCVSSDFRIRTLRDLINDLGVPARLSRVGALRRHVLELPTPVVADALGYHHHTTTRAAAQAPLRTGPRTRKPAGRTPPHDSCLRAPASLKPLLIRAGTAEQASVIETAFDQ